MLQSLMGSLPLLQPQEPHLPSGCDTISGERVVSQLIEHGHCQGTHGCVVFKHQYGRDERENR